MTLAAAFSYAGLAGFVAVFAVNLVVLLADAYLLLTRQTTISHRVWAQPILFVAPVAWQLIGALSLAVHLLISPY